MPGGKDYPDWGGTYNAGQFYPLFDMAELAARLGSPITYDRRGGLIWFYDFHYGLGDVGADGILGGGVNLSADYWERPPFSAWLYTGANDSSQAHVERRMPVPQSLRVGFQASLRFGAEADHVQLTLDHYDGTTRWCVELDIDPYNSRLRASTEEGGYVVLDAALPDLNTGYYFVHAKVVADLSDHSLIRVLLDGDEYDLSAHSMQPIASGLAPHIRGKVLLDNIEAAAANLFVDTMILTAAEP